jgi:hypothetical protein
VEAKWDEREGKWMGDGSGLSPQGFGGTITGSVEGGEGGKNQELDFFFFLIGEMGIICRVWAENCFG